MDRKYIISSWNTSQLFYISPLGKSLYIWLYVLNTSHHITPVETFRKHLPEANTRTQIIYGYTFGTDRQYYHQKNKCPFSYQANFIGSTLTGEGNAGAPPTGRPLVGVLFCRLGLPAIL